MFDLILTLYDKYNIEIWRTVPGYRRWELQVSNLGNARGKRGQLKLQQNNKGYYRIETTIRVKRCRILIHRAVISAFFPGEYQEIEARDIDHIDTNKQNNRIVNLSPITHSDNIRLMWQRKKAAEETPLNPESEEPLPF